MRHRARGMPDKLVTLECHHSVAGRARLRPSQEMEAEDLLALSDRVATLPGISRVLARPNTGSLILECDADPETVFAAMEAQGIARVRTPAPPPPIGQVAQLGMLQADMKLKQSTNSALDLNTSIALLLAVIAAFQASRGKLAGPATTLLMSALSALDRGARK